MAVNTQLDSRLLENLYLPYDRTTSELSLKPRIVRGLNAAVTIGGKLTKRPGTSLYSSLPFGHRVDRIWGYSTSDKSSQFYIILSVFNSSSGFWELWYKFIPDSAPTVWTSFGAYRDLNKSTSPHVVTSFGGKLYIKSFPASSSTEKLGTVVFNGEDSTIKPWGILGPTIPARIQASVTYLQNSINDLATVITVKANYGSMPATPFVALLFYPGRGIGEYVIVTSVAGTTWTIVRSLTAPEAHDAGAIVLYKNWGVSAHAVDVKVGWAYTYAYKSSTGQISNRAPLETNPDLPPSNTFPFVDRKPAITVQGHADTTHIPTIVIYRSQDGGGVYHKLEEIANTGAGNITYIDDSLGSGVSGTTFDDPIPDDSLDEANRSPGLDTNTPPPTVLAPGIIGTTTPEVTTNMISYGGRILYGIRNFLLFSAKDEVPTGIPVESWPSGLDANAESMQHSITNLVAGKNGVYIFTTEMIYKMTGTTRETFNIRPISENIGGLRGEKTSVRLGNDVAFMSSDYRVHIIDASTDAIKTISDPLNTDLTSSSLVATINATFELTYYSESQREWLVVSKIDSSNLSNSRQWVYDIKLSDSANEPFWFTPWDIRCSATYAGRTATLQRRFALLFASQDDTGVNSALTELADGVATKPYLGPPTTDPQDLTYKFFFDTNLFMCPPGNHMNDLRGPGLTPIFDSLILERSRDGVDDDPDVYFYYDDILSSPVAASIDERQTQREDSKGYKTMTFKSQVAAQRIGFGVSSHTAQKLEFYTATLVFNPDHGA